MSQNKKYSKKHRKQNVKWLPILVVAGGVLLIGLALLASRQNPAPKVPLEVSGSPSLKVDKDQVNLGDVKVGKTVEVSFQLTNVGDQTLRFNKQPFVEVVEGC